MTDQPFEDLATRLERERQDADRRYNDALTALDRAIQQLPALPSPPAAFDERALAEANRSWDILPDGAPTIDGSLKGRLSAFIWRIVGGPLDRQKHFNAALVDHLNRNVASAQQTPQALAATVDALRGQLEGLARFESLLVQYLQTITLYVDSKDRGLAGPELRDRIALAEQRILALKRDLENRPAASAAPSPSAASAAPASSGTAEASTYVGFEDRFRGPQHEIRRRVEDYLPILRTATDVLDVGCGRGELLELLKEQGITARGVDGNSAMVEVCRARGLAVEAGDALGYLTAQPDASLGGLIAIQVVEHFEPAYLARFLETAFHKMRPGAPLILETINPACWMAFFETYLRDLTHQRPLHPETLRYLVQASGFQSVDVQFRQPVGDGDKLNRVTLPRALASATDSSTAALVQALNDHADKLNARLFSSMDYAIVARR